MDAAIYVVVIHKPSGQAFTLSRNYRLRDATLPSPQEHVATAVDTWEGWLPSSVQKPAWATGKPAEEFTAYWKF